VPAALKAIEEPDDDERPRQARTRDP